MIAFRGICVEGNVQPGQKVLINGAGGAAGSFAVQLAKLRGAEVTGVDHTDKLDFLRSLGADHVIDYTSEDFTRTGHRYHLVLDVIADRSVFAYARALLPGGSCLVVGGAVTVLLQCLTLGPLIRKSTSKRIRVLMVPQNRDDLASITELCEAGKVIPPIDRTYPLSELPEALRYVCEGRQKGKVVVAVEADSDT